MKTRTSAAPSAISLLRDELHSLFADVPAPTARGRHGVAVDVIDGAGEVEIRMDLLPLAPDDLVVEVDGDVLRLKGSRLIEVDEGGESLRTHLRKRWHFLRGIQIPPELDAASATAHYAHGQLTVILRKR